MQNDVWESYVTRTKSQDDSCEMSIKTWTKSEIKETTIVKLIGSIGKGETKQAARILDYILWSLKIYHLKISFNT